MLEQWRAHEHLLFKLIINASHVSCFLKAIFLELGVGLNLLLSLAISHIFICLNFIHTQNYPVEKEYAPPINIKVRDNRIFGRKPVVGVHSITLLAPLKCEAPSRKRNVPRPGQLLGIYSI